MRIAAAVVGLTLLLAGCGGDPAWKELGAQLTEKQEEQSRLAVKAKDAMFQKLFARLQAAVKEGGPVAAIEVCKSAAPAIAKEVGAEHGVQIGRTAHKLRNPANAPPDWAKGYVTGAAYAKSKGEKPVQLAHEDGRFAALLPIHLKQGCLGCHGPKESIQPPVQEALAKAYPQDRATGFQAGDLRGWFWIEVPAR